MLELLLNQSNVNQTIFESTIEAIFWFALVPTIGISFIGLFVSIFMDECNKRIDNLLK